MIWNLIVWVSFAITITCSLLTIRNLRRVRCSLRELESRSR